jgi:hypothetical protein
MIGAVPNSAWVEGCVARDAAGFIKLVPIFQRKSWKPACQLFLPSETFAAET